MLAISVKSLDSLPIPIVHTWRSSLADTFALTAKGCLKISLHISNGTKLISTSHFTTNRILFAFVVWHSRCENRCCIAFCRCWLARRQPISECHTINGTYPDKRTTAIAVILEALKRTQTTRAAKVPENRENHGEQQRNDGFRRISAILSQTSPKIVFGNACKAILFSLLAFSMVVAGLGEMVHCVRHSFDLERSRITAGADDQFGNNSSHLCGVRHEEANGQRSDGSASGNDQSK